MSELALKLIKEAKETRATRLDLGNCGLTELPDELFELTWLEQLELCNEWVFFDTEKKEWISIQSENVGKPNKFKYINKKISTLKRLEVLMINGNYGEEWGVVDIEPLSTLTNLTLLDIAYTQVSDLTPLIYLSNLTWLNIRGTKITDLSPLEALEQLRELIAREINIENLMPIKDLSDLVFLDVSSTLVCDLEPLRNLVCLRFIHAYNLKLDDISPLKNLVNLELLNIRNTKISDLSPLTKLLKKGY